MVEAIAVTLIAIATGFAFIAYNHPKEYRVYVIPIASLVILIISILLFMFMYREFSNEINNVTSLINVSAENFVNKNHNENDNRKNIVELSDGAERLRFLLDVSMVIFLFILGAIALFTILSIIPAKRNHFDEG